jgi:hypothetical protein
MSLGAAAREWRAHLRSYGGRYRDDDGTLLSRLAGTLVRSYLEGVAVSERVQQILSDVRELTDEDKAQLEAELLVENVVANPAWGEEIDRRAARVLTAEASGLSRDEVRSLFAMSPTDARARLAALLDPARR